MAAQSRQGKEKQGGEGQRKQMDGRAWPGSIRRISTAQAMSAQFTEVLSARQCKVTNGSLLKTGAGRAGNQKVSQGKAWQLEAQGKEGHVGYSSAAQGYAV